MTALQLFFIAQPWIMAVLIPAIAITALVTGRRSASVWVAAYLIPIFFFPNASWGLLESSVGQNFYTRATGTFYFSAINIMLFGLTLQAFLSRRIGLPYPVPHNLRLPALLFGLIIVGNLVVGFATPSLRWFQIISYSGLLNIFNFMLCFYVLVSAMRDPRDMDRLVNLILVCVVARGLWGVARFVALGGDPANVYANYQHIDVKLTFFDINDGLLALMALFIAAWRLANSERLKPSTRAMYGAIVTLELFIIVFSHRRTAWGGLVLAAVFFAFCQRRMLRSWLLVLYTSVGLPLLLYKLVQRGGDETRGAGLLERLLPDVVSGGKISFSTGRFSELYAASLSIADSPIWGLGAWGRYSGFRFSDLTWPRGDFSWMHSGVLHILLKAGIIGVAVTVLVAVLLVVFYRRARPHIAPEHAAAFCAGFAGLLFMLPTWLVGTPIIEFRTMQLLALCVALPYIVAAASAALRRESPTAASATAAAPAADRGPRVNRLGVLVPGPGGA